MTASPHSGMTKHRIDALTDGIFAVAMTLLVIELKIPESMHVKSNADLVTALLHLIPKFIGWVVSFLVLGIFWFTHHRAFSYVRHVDGKLIAINLFFLGFVSFMPFASSLTGEYTRTLASQIVYAATMLAVAVCSRVLWRYIHFHPELCATPMGADVLAGGRARTTMLMAISVLSVAIAIALPGAGNMAFILMGFAGAVGRRAEAKARARLESTSLSI